MEHKLLGGRYELLDIIGEGGMGTVYRAHCRVLDRTVAVKILKPELKNDPSFIEKFKIEGLAAAKINSPNIVNVYVGNTRLKVKSVVNARFSKSVPVRRTVAKC